MSPESQPGAAEAPAVSLDFPPGWFTLQCDPEIDRELVPAAVAARLAVDSGIGAQDAIVKVLLGWSQTAADEGAFLAAMRWVRDATFGMGVATLTVRAFARDPGTVAAELERLRPLLAEVTPADEFPPRLQAEQLPVGPSLRMEAVRRPSAPSTPLRLVIEYWIPLEDAGGAPGTVQLSFGTSNLALADELSSEFDLIAFSLLLGEPPA